MKKTIIFLSFFLILFKKGYSNSDSLVIVEDKHANAVIVIPDSTTEQIKSIANFLQKTIQKSTGVVIPVANRAENEKLSIHIGLTKFVKERNLNLNSLNEDGFL